MQLLTIGLGALIAGAGSMLPGSADARSQADDFERLLSLSLEELGQLQVTSASRGTDALWDVAASVYVIHREDIAAAGVRSLPEALLLAPNLHVARTDTRGFAVSARGMKTTLSNKLLVLVDGRPVYTALFAGVLWDQQDTLIADIERIEVISGPGAAAWGSNAVHGVINVITRSAADTVGGTAMAYAGESGNGAAVRQGWRMGTDGAMRVYAKRSAFDATETASGASVGDGWEQTQAGFRSDWERGRDTLRVQGDVFSAQSDPRAVGGAVEVDGYNVLAHWTRTIDAASRLELQAFIDVVDRADPLVLFDRMRIIDIEAQHTRSVDAHTLVWGGGYRHGRDDSAAGLFARLLPARRSLEWANLFIEDKVAVSERLSLDLGLRAESNSYTGLEWLPSARFSWRASEESVLWGSASRAVRAPARFDRAFFFPASEPFLIRGGPEFESEVAKVAELGFRSQPTEVIGVSVTLFHHWYHGLRSGRDSPLGGVEVANGVEGRSWGLEAWASMRIPGEWELALGVLELRDHLQTADGRSDDQAVRDQGNDPEHQVMLRVSRKLWANQQVFVHARHVSALPSPYVPSYASIDARWSWHPSAAFALGVGVRNLLDDRHAEFEPRAGYQQSVFGRTLLVDARLDW